jgi:hypothetical protein
MSGKGADIKLESVGNLGGRFCPIGRYFNSRPMNSNRFDVIGGLSVDHLCEYLWM